MIREYKTRYPMNTLIVWTEGDWAEVGVDGAVAEIDHHQTALLVHQLQRFIAVQKTKKAPGDTGWSI